MALMWTDALAVGVPEIDEQHRELFRRVDRLLEAGLGTDAGEVSRMLAFLDEYVATHFEWEERFMREARYPGYAAHQAEHAQFVEQLRTLDREQADRGMTPDLAGRLNHMVGDWLRSHVGVTDKAVGRFIGRARRP
jgi:hemerythrin